MIVLMRPDGIERTPAQKMALREAYALLASHFDDVLIVASTQADIEALGTDLEVYWKGSWLAANGLADYAKQKISIQRRRDRAPDSK